MKKMLAIMTLIIMVFGLTSCMAFYNVKTKQSDKFKKSIMSEYKEIKKLTIKRSVPLLIFLYSTKGELDEKVMYEIFYKTVELVNNKEFKEEHFVNDDKITRYDEKKSGTDRIYPEVHISFDTNNDGESEHKFYSLFHLIPDNLKGKYKNDVNEWKLDVSNGEDKVVPIESTAK